MSDDSQSWGLGRHERRMVLGVRAAGLLLVGLGVPILAVVIWTVYRAGWSEIDGEPAWRFGSLLDQMRTKSFIIEFVSSTGAHLAAIVAGVYLMRCDPRPLLRSSGAKV